MNLVERHALVPRAFRIRHSENEATYSGRGTKQIERRSIALVLDKGSAALANRVALEEARLGWISALPYQAPEELRSRTLEKLPQCSSAQPGVRALAEPILAHLRQYLCVASLASEQMHSLTASCSLFAA